MKRETIPGWARGLARLSVNRPVLMLIALLLVTFAAFWQAGTLQLRMNFIDLLPEHHPDAVGYKQIVDEYGEQSIIIAIEGERDDMVAFAEEIVPTLREMDGVYHVEGAQPQEYFLDHGFMLQKPKDFDRWLRMYDDPSLTGVLRGINDDFEREYTDNDDNLRDDELMVARGLLGMGLALDRLEQGLSGDEANADEGVRALLAGEPWMLSLDRKMLLVAITPKEPMWSASEAALELTTQVEEYVSELAAEHPEVKVSFTGMGPIGVDEMNSVGTYTQLLTLAAWILVYLLLVRNFRSWGLPWLAMLPLAVGIIWALGLMAVVFGSINIMTVMLGLVLIGLGIDFTLHLVTRFCEERGTGHSLEDALAITIGGTGRGVLTGGLTTAAAFFALMIADTRGVFEFGFSAGAGVLLTLVAVFLTLPPLLVLREKRYTRKGRVAPLPPDAEEGWPLLGSIAVWSFKRPALVLIVMVLLGGACFYVAWTDIPFEYNFLNLEPEGLTSVEMQQGIPDRFGMSDQSGWITVTDIERARVLKDTLDDKPAVGSVSSVSDYVTKPAWVDEYAPQLATLRERIASNSDPSTDTDELYEQISRLWDNLDTMSNQAYMAGVDRVWPVIDILTGYDTETNETDTTAVFPSLQALFEDDAGRARVQAVAAAWNASLAERMPQMANSTPGTLDNLPETVRKSLLPMDGSAEYLLRVSPRESIWEKDKLDRFDQQVEDVAGNHLSTAELFIVMTVETLRDGRTGSLLALGVIFILLLFHFRGTFGLMAVIPLLSGALLMLGLMYVTGMKYNYINLIAVPVILGIGIDDGVHALHRFRELSGSALDRIRTAFSRVGRAILLTSVTTMIGFGSIAFYTMRGMASFGMVLFLGVGFCFLSTVFVLPAVVRVFVRDNN